MAESDKNQPIHTMLNLEYFSRSTNDFGHPVTRNYGNQVLPKFPRDDNVIACDSNIVY
jgi:hypothetical protein